jgi:hypothetical protein
VPGGQIWFKLEDGGDALGNGRPTEHRRLVNRLAGAFERLAITFEEADLPVLDDADRQADHVAFLHERLQPLIDPGIIDHGRLVADGRDRRFVTRGCRGRRIRRTAEPEEQCHRCKQRQDRRKQDPPCQRTSPNC